MYYINIFEMISWYTHPKPITQNHIISDNRDCAVL